MNEEQERETRREIHYILLMGGSLGSMFFNTNKSSVLELATTQIRSKASKNAKMSCIMCFGIVSSYKMVRLMLMGDVLLHT